MCFFIRNMIVVLIFAFSLLTFIEIGLADDVINKDSALETSSQDIENQDTQIEDGAIKLFMDKIEVLGRLERPQAVYIVPGNNPQVDDIRIDRNFFSEIFRPVEKEGRRSTSTQKKQETRRKDFIPW